MKLFRLLRRTKHYLLHNRNELFVILLSRIASIIPDKTFIRIKFRLRNGYWPNLSNPKSFNEKIQWLKFNHLHPEFTRLVDKATAKDYVKEIIGEKYLIPTIGIWNTIEDIDWEMLPNQFVIKATHDSGGVVVCKDKNLLDIKNAISKLLETKNWTTITKEYPYAHVKPRYLAEQYLEDESGYELKDYKFFCFNGVPRFLFVATDRQKGSVKFDFFDMEWNFIPVTNGHPNNPIRPMKPNNFEEMVDVAKKLSNGMEHVRVDLYNVNGKIYFGELTFFHNSGMFPFVPREWDYNFGEFLQL